MFLKSLKLLALPLAFLYAGSAYAFFDAELLLGKRWYELDTDPKANISSQEVAVAAHLDPIPLVPVSFGLKLAMGTLSDDDVKSGLKLDSVDTAQIFEPAIEVMAWLPMVPVVTPYVRLDVPVGAKATLEGKSGGRKIKDEADVTGYNLGVGVKYSVIPTLKVLAELNRGSEKFKETKLTVDGTSGTKDSYDLNSNAFLIGVEFGI